MSDKNEKKTTQQLLQKEKCKALANQALHHKQLAEQAITHFRKLLIAGMDFGDAIEMYNSIMDNNTLFNELIYVFENESEGIKWSHEDKGWLDELDEIGMDEEEELFKIKIKAKKVKLEF